MPKLSNHVFPTGVKYNPLLKNDDLDKYETDLIVSQDVIGFTEKGASWDGMI